MRVMRCTLSSISKHTRLFPKFPKQPLPSSISTLSSLHREASVPMYKMQQFTSSVRTFSSAPNGAEILKSFGDRSTSFEGKNVSKAMEALAKADAVCFDVDSTVIQEEGIDVLADSLGKGEVVAEWTAKAMTGNVKFEDALAARLSIIQPSENAILQCLKNNPLQLSPGIETLIRSLSDAGVSVYLVSGGFRIMIEPIAMEVGVPKDRIYANSILFDDKGGYTGFDADELTSRDLGKPKALEEIKKKGNYKTMVMVGDGATDAQARPPADAFIGYGGVVVRETVKEKACWYVMDFEDMITIVNKYKEKVLTPNDTILR